MVAVVAFILPFSVAGQVPEPKVPKVPGDNYTNGVSMSLVKIGGYWAGRFEVTQKQFEKVMGYNPAASSGMTIIRWTM